VVIIDDFFTPFSDLLTFAHDQDFYEVEEANRKFGQTHRWKGRRSANLCGQATVVQTAIEKALHLPILMLFVHKHPAAPEEEGHWHRDNSVTAGVIYLEGGAGCGTEVGESLIEFRPNRLISYDGKILHRPQGFTHDRMVITFFSRRALPSARRAWPSWDR